MLLNNTKLKKLMIISNEDGINKQLIALRKLLRP